jgi:tRNA(fMet)-specific endonuclease VapC
MTYLVDSDWVADYLDGRQPAVALLARLVPSGIAISLVTYGEIFEGIYYGLDPQKAEATFHAFLRGVPMLPLNRRVMQRFARIRGELRGRGLLIPDPDLLIAATALHNGLILVSRNRRHFERIADLQIQ